MPSDDALLHEIRENPDDDTPRLVFADWYEDNDDQERAEFVRVQIELARTPWPESRWFTLHSRQQRVLEPNCDRWLRGLPKDCWPKVTFERGFVSQVLATGKQFLRWSAKLKERTPLMRVSLHSTEKVFVELTERPVFSGIRQLVMTDLKKAEEFDRLARRARTCRLSDHSKSGSCPASRRRCCPRCCARWRCRPCKACN